MRTAPRSRVHRWSSLRLGVAVAAMSSLVGGLVVPTAAADRLDPIAGLGDEQRDIGVGDFFGDGPEAALSVTDRAAVVFDPWTGLVSVAPIAESISVDLAMDDHRNFDVGDLDGDGFDDVVATFPDPLEASSFHIAWWRGREDRSFAAGQVLDFAPSREIGVGDFTDDPGDEVLRIDDVGANPSVESSMRFHHPGRRGPVLWTSTESPEIVWDRRDIRYVFGGDVVPGGHDEAIVIDAPSTFTYRVIVFAGRDTAWRPEVVWTSGPEDIDIEEAAAGDVNGDGLVDLVILTDAEAVSAVWVLAADGRGGFEDPVRVWVGPREEAPETFYGTADINRDGLDDLVATSGESPVRFFGSVTDLLVEDPPALPPLRCAGRLVTVDLRFGDEPTEGDDVILGTDGPDVIRAGAGADTVCGGGGDDRVIGGAGNDRLVGGAGNDRLVGGAGNDRLVGGGGNDRLVGRSGNDRIVGGQGRDRLVGGAGRDRLIGGPGIDRCIGGPGADTTKGCP